VSAAAARVLRETIESTKAHIVSLDAAIAEADRGLATAQQELTATEKQARELARGLADPSFGIVAEEIQREIRKCNKAVERLETRISDYANERHGLAEDRKRAADRLTRLEATAAGLGAA